MCYLAKYGRLAGEALQEAMHGHALQNQLSGNSRAGSYQADDSHARRLDDARTHGSPDTLDAHEHRVSVCIL